MFGQHSSEPVLNLQGVIGVICVCIVLGIFFPPLVPVMLIIWILNLIFKASEAHDKWAKRQAEMPQQSELMSNPFIAQRPEDVF